MQQLFGRLRKGVPVAEKDGNPSDDLILKWQNAMALLESVPAIQQAAAAATAAAAAANAAAATANAAAATANDAADAVTAESSLVNSFPTNYTAPLVSSDNLGNVTIAAHDRQYGDTTLDPTVAVTGDTFASAAVATDVVFVFYDDPSRIGGGVTYQFMVNPANPPVQGGNRHVVGSVEVPAVGTAGGDPVRNPGYPIP